MANDSKKYVSLNRLSNFLENIKGKYSQIGHKHTIADVTDYKIDTALSSTSTNPVQNKVLDAEFDAMATAMGALELAIDAKSDSTHNHDGRYYTESEIDSKLEDKASATHNHDDKYDAKGAAADVQTNLNAVSDTINTHSGNSNIHVTATNKSNWNDAYAHSASAHARTDATKVADSATNGNILINGTETNVYTHPNSGVTAGTYKSVTVSAQGHITAGSNPTTLAGYGITDAETKGAANSALETAKAYADSVTTTLKNDLLNGAGEAYDTLKELGELIGDNQDAIEALEKVASGKSDKVHGHAIADVSGLQSALDGKASSSHGTHVSYSTTTPVMDGTASVGSASTVARSDHKHPTDTSRASKTEFDTHTGNTTIHITATERTNWNAAKTHADSAHAPSNAEKNQNAFSNIKVGSTTVVADTTTDTLELVGSNVTITPDVANDKVTFSVANGSTSEKGVVQLTNSTSSTSTTTAATPNSVKSAYDLANTAKTNAATAQTRADNAYTLAESKVDSLSDLGITATATELNYVDGVTSNIQTQLDSIKNAKADWNQNDSTQLDYVKNRPFYTADPVDTTIAEGTIPANGMMQTTATITSLTLGESYKAIFDGTTYNNLVCENYDGLPTIMNDAFMFAIQSGRAMAYAANGSVSHTIKVMGSISTVVPLERKYIAEHIDSLAGEKVVGKTYTIDGEEVIAGKGAEVFNDYSTNIASGQYAHAEGVNNIADGSASHAEGYGVKATGSYSHAEGYETTASESRSHAEGWSTEATAQAAHAEGFATHATGQFSHAEGDNSTASGRASHAEGYGTDAVADYSHAEGMNTNASSKYQHVQGKYNVIDENDKYVHIVGNGTGNSARSNAHTLDWSGNAWFKGAVYVGGIGQDDASASKLLSESDVLITVDDIDTICGSTISYANLNEGAF